LNDSEINNPLVELVNSGGEVYVENAKNMLEKHVLNLKKNNPDQPKSQKTKF
jgi:hypothetical protein